MEAEDDDEFGELYFDVLQPFSSLPSPKIKNAEQNVTDVMPEACSTSSANIVKIPTDDKGVLEKEKDVVGTVKLEIYLGSRRVLENSFVFALSGQVGQGHNDPGFNQAENLVTGGGTNGLNSVHPSVNHSKCDPNEKMVDGDDVGCELNSYPEGDSNSDPELDRKASGTSEGHGTDISLDDAPLCNDNVKGNENLMVMDAPSNVEMLEICTGNGSKCEPSEEGQLSEYAEPLDYEEEMVIMTTTSNSVEARNGCNNLQYPPLYRSPLQDTRNVGATTFGEAIIPWSQATSSKTYGYQAQAVRPPPRPTVNRYPDMSSSLFDLDLDSLEHRQWRYPTVDLSQYFNYGLNETSWKSYCEEIKTMRRYHAGKQIQVENGLRNRYPSAKTTPQLPQDSTATIQREQTKCYRPQELERSGEGSFKSLQDEQQIRPTANASRCDNQEHNPKRAKMVEESSRDSSSNISDNEWMCRHVGMDSWFHPISMSRHQETDRKGSRKGRSKLERWTRHDRDNDDENTSTSSLSSPPNAGVAIQLEDS